MGHYIGDILPFIKKLHAFSGKGLYFNLVGMGLMSLLEGVGILLLIPMIQASGMVKFNSSSTGVSRFFSFFQTIPHALGISIILGIFLFIMIGQNFLQKTLSIRKVAIIQAFIHQLRMETYQTLLEADWNFFIRKRKSDLVNLFTVEMGRIHSGINLFLQLMTSLVFSIIQVGLALYLAPTITLFVLVSGMILALFARKFIKLSNRLGYQTSELAMEYMAGMTEQLNGIKDIKSNSLEISRLSWLQNLTGKMLKEQVEYIQIKMSSQFFYKSASAILLAGFIFLSLTLFHSQPEQFLLVIVIFSRLWPKVTDIQSSLEQIASIAPAFSIWSTLHKEAKENAELKLDMTSRERKNIRLEKGIECHHIHFRYHKEKPMFTLQDINLTIPANHMTAIVGRSGAGKSTLIDIIMGLLQPENGKVIIDGSELTREMLPALRQSISYVPQDPFLFHASIRENLRMSDSKISDSELWEALAFASADFVKALPQGLDTIIGDRGIRLSGGERQRIVLARAILRKPSILVLDEATSSLDTENETKIQEAIENMRGSMTIIVIAHRLSTIRNADQVIVLEQGRIIQRGGFTQLANEKRGMFSHLLSHQVGIGQ